VRKSRIREGKNKDLYIDAHRKHISEAESAGNLIFGGTVIPKNLGAHLLFNCKDETIPYDFVKADPYYKNGLVTSYKIQEIEIETNAEKKDLAKLYTFR